MFAFRAFARCFFNFAIRHNRSIQKATARAENPSWRMGHDDKERGLSASRPRRRGASGSREFPLGCTLQRLRDLDPEGSSGIRGERRHRVSSGDRCSLRRVQVFR